jgi:hypothetical protein
MTGTSQVAYYLLEIDQRTAARDGAIEYGEIVLGRLRQSRNHLEELGVRFDLREPGLKHIQSQRTHGFGFGCCLMPRGNELVS